MNIASARMIWVGFAVLLVALGLLNLSTGTSVGGVLLPLAAAMFAVTALQRRDGHGRRSRR